jgi:hypothetical protein
MLRTFGLEANRFYVECFGVHILRNYIMSDSQATRSINRYLNSLDYEKISISRTSLHA